MTPHANTYSQNSSRPKLRGSHHLPPSSIFYVWSQVLHPNVILSWDLQVGGLKILEIKTLMILEAHNFF
jgi:hypothetical protein